MRYLRLLGPCLVCLSGAALAAGCGDDTTATGANNTTSSGTAGGGSVGGGTGSGGDAGSGGGSHTGGGGGSSTGGSGGSGGSGGGGGMGPPMLVAATFIGDAGNGKPGQNQSARNAVWSQAGDIIVTGLGGDGAPVTIGAYQTSYAGAGNGGNQALGGDCWVGRLSANLSSLTAATLYGGDQDERPCYGLAELSNGNIAIAGQTHSSTGIATSGALQATKPGNGTDPDGFVAILSADLTTRIAGTYLGGPGAATMRGGVKLLSSGALLAFGQINASGLGSNGAYQQYSAGGFNEAWLGALSSDLSSLQWGTYLGSGSGQATEVVVGAAEMADGHIVLLSSSPSNNWLNNARTHGSVPYGGDASKPFVARLNPAGTQTVDWFTVLGPGEGNSVIGQTFQEAGMGVDTAGNVYVAGETSKNYGTAGAYQTTNQGGGDCFVCKVAAAGALSWCTLVGSAGQETCLAPVAAPSGRVLVAGRTTSASFCAGADQVLNGSHSGQSDAFLAMLAPDGSALEWCTLLGGSNDEVARWIARDNNGSIVLTGMTKSADFPATAGAYDTSFNGGQEDMFVARYDNLPW